MTSQRKPLISFTPLCLLASALLLLLPTTHARHFEVSNTTSGVPCAMVDIVFDATIRAEQGGKVVAVKNVTQDDEDVRGSGVCLPTLTELSVLFGEKSLWSLTFKPTPDKPSPTAMYRNVVFVPKEIFGETVDVSDQLVTYDPRPVYLSSTKDSYLCEVEDKLDYTNYFAPVPGFNFTVTVRVKSIQAQGFELTSSKYGPPETCHAL